MMALAGIPLGFRFRFLEPAPEPAARGLGEVVVAPYDDPGGIEAFSRGLSMVTYEFENVPVETAGRLARTLPVDPAPAALEMAQDRLAEKEGFRRLGIATVPFRAVGSVEELREGVGEIGLPAVLKTRRFGYDGKGQAILETEGDLKDAWDRLGGRPLILEGFVSFRRELSVLAVRGRDGARATWPLVENVHEDGILRMSRSPVSDLDPDRAEEAARIASRIMDELQYVGVLAVELFETDDGLLVNEMAPRVHNSGHWTQNGAVTSQFENHVRAVAGLPLGSVEPLGHSAMVNLLGTLPDMDELLRLPGVHLHLYDKASRPGRKLGHVNIRASDLEQVDDLLAEVLRLVGWSG